MKTPPQKRALNRYRKRLSQRGMARFEVLGLDADRELMIIAAVAEANDCVVVTENERDFAGLKIVNPLRAQPLQPITPQASRLKV